MRYHMGTIAFASLVVAIILFIRVCVKFLEEVCARVPACVSECAWEPCHVHVPLCVSECARGTFHVLLLTCVQKTKAAQGGELARWQKFLFCLIKCCLKCAECCMKYISKNALIWVRGVQ